jgi:hypothetical protein
VLAVERDHADGLLGTPNHAAGGGERRRHQRLLEPSLKPAELTPAPFALVPLPSKRRDACPPPHPRLGWTGTDGDLGRPTVTDLAAREVFV